MLVLTAIRGHPLRLLGQTLNPKPLSFPTPQTEKSRARKLGGDLIDDGDNGDAERAAEAEAEFERAKERLTLRHRNTSKWARRALKRGVEVRAGLRVQPLQRLG